MTYHLERLRPHQPRQQITLLPLSDLPSAPTRGISRGLLIVIAVVIVLIVIVWLLTPRGEGRRQLERNPVRKMSTADLAKNLYDRLERRGSANPATMRSLEAYSRKRT